MPTNRSSMQRAPQNLKSSPGAFSTAEPLASSSAISEAAEARAQIKDYVFFYPDRVDRSADRRASCEIAAETAAQVARLVAGASLANGSTAQR